VQETDETLQAAVNDLTRLFAGRLAGAIEVRYDSIHLQLVDDLSSGDVAAIDRTLGAHSRPIRHWRVQQVNRLLLLSIVTGDAEQD
jgi:hypothetical protein